MNKYKEGDHVWWLTPSHTPHFVAVAVQQVLVLKIQSQGIYLVKNVQEQSVILLDSQLYATKKDALNACIRQLQEALFNE